MSRLVVALAIALLTISCGDRGAAPSVDVGSSAMPATATDLALPRCGKPPSPAPEPAPDGAVLPPTTVLTAVREQPPLTQLNGYAEMTPTQIRAWIEGESGLEVLAAAQELHATELLVSDGVYNTFVRARAICAGASTVAEVIAPTDSDAQLPTPAGATAAATSTP